MKRFAYLDKGGVLHMVKNQADAVKYAANGKVETVDMEVSANGYPIVNIGGEEKDLVCYSDCRMYYDGNEKNGVLVDPLKYEGLKKLIERLK